MAYLSQQYSEAHFQAQVAKSSEILEAYIKEIRLLEILSLHELSRWEEAQILAKDWATLYAPTIDVEKTYSKKPPFKKVERAKLLSTIVPGLGQVYAGYPFQGLSSLLLQSASLGFGVYSVVNEYYLSGFFTGAGLFQAFYFGGIRHTEFLAEKRNVFLKNRYNQKLAKEFLK
jgi:TM2 domain-containing membrane protein YozV